jgi:hypothetical protein
MPVVKIDVKGKRIPVAKQPRSQLFDLGVIQLLRRHCERVDLAARFCAESPGVCALAVAADGEILLRRRPVADRNIQSAKRQKFICH